jgi:hypothetical protein
MPMRLPNCTLSARPLFLALCGLLACANVGCATIRVTDPARTATEQFLMTEAAARAIEQLSANALRDRLVYIDSTYLSVSEQQFLLGELRYRLLASGVRLVPTRDAAQVVLEARSGGVGIDRHDYLLGIPAIVLSQGSTAGPTAGGVPLITPEIAIIKNIKQQGYASVAFVAYWANSGELIASSGPFIGRTLREDYFFFGTGPRTVGNIPTTEQPR